MTPDFGNLRPVPGNYREESPRPEVCDMATVAPETLLRHLRQLAAGPGFAAKEPEANPAAKSAPAAPAERKDKAADGAAKDTMTLQGQVVDLDGKPVAGARLYLLGGDGKDQAPAKVRATTDRDGRFRLTAACAQATLVAVADGYALDWITDFRNPDRLDLGLVKDDVPVTGRILDLQGKPVAGVTLKPHALKAPLTGKLDSWLEATKVRKGAGVPPESEQMSLAFWLPALADLFPRITTDADGRFRISGVGRERVIALIVEGPRVETQEINVVTRAGVTPFQLPSWGGFFDPQTQVHYYGADFEHVSPPCRPVAGTVRDRVTGKPVAGAVVRAEATVGYPSYRVQTTADAEGRYRLMGLPRGREGQGVSVVALPPEGQPYQAMKKRAGGAGLDPAALDFSLKRGVWVQGRVTDKATGRGVPARLRYSVFRDGLEKGEEQELFIPPPWGDGSYTDKEGRFRLLAYSGRGLLGARATGDHMEEYRISLGLEGIRGGQQIGGQLRFPTIPFETCTYDADFWKEINPAPGTETLTCDCALESGRPIRVRVEDADGKPLEGVSVHGQYGRLSWFVRLPASHQMPAEFPLYGLGEGKSRTLLFRHLGKGLAGSREIKGDDSGTVAVRLGPAASVRGRLLNDDGRPWRHTELPVRFTLREQPGWVFEHGDEKVQTDAEGRFRIDGLVPGLKYSATVLQAGGQQVYPREVFAGLTLTSGQTRDLGDVTPKKARDAD